MKRKLKLSELKVQSFTTTLTRGMGETLAVAQAEVDWWVLLTLGRDSAARSCLHVCGSDEYCGCVAPDRI